jgi:hypothetical protein
MAPSNIVDSLLEVAIVNAILDPLIFLNVVSSHNRMIPIVMVTFSSFFTCAFFFFDFGKKYDERRSSLRLRNSSNDIVDFGFPVLCEALLQDTSGESKEQPQEEQNLSPFEQ